MLTQHCSVYLFSGLKWDPFRDTFNFGNIKKAHGAKWDGYDGCKSLYQDVLYGKKVEFLVDGWVLILEVQIHNGLFLSAHISMLLTFYDDIRAIFGLGEGSYWKTQVTSLVTILFSENMRFCNTLYDNSVLTSLLFYPRSYQTKKKTLCQWNIYWNHKNESQLCTDTKLHNPMKQ